MTDINIETRLRHHLTVLLEACERARDAAGRPINGQVSLSVTAFKDFASQIRRTKQDMERVYD